MKRTITKLYTAILIALSLVSSIHAANINIEGLVKDSQTKDPLQGANVILIGTSMGSTTDFDGKYAIHNVLPGSYTLRVSYIGYKSQQIKIQVSENSKNKYDFTLVPEEIQGQTVTVTAQAEGQQQAINTQIAADRIINVVSAAKIQELPDANAAESVGRLPGVSVLRSGGEGDKVVIRGLDPKYNTVEINGVRMASSDQNDRSTDLSMISPNMLEGIEVIKTVTPDLDANVIGGVVNFQLSQARVQTNGIPKFSLLAQGSYNSLPDATNKYNNYKFVGNIENRFFDNLFGLFISGSIERRNLSSDELHANYGNKGFDLTSYLINTVTLDGFSRDRRRGNAVVSLDYALPDNGKIILSNLFSTSKTASIDRQQVYNISAVSGLPGTMTWGVNYTNSTLNNITNMMRWDQQFSIFHVNANVAHSYSEAKDPSDWLVNFITNHTGIGSFASQGGVNPKSVVAAGNSADIINNTQLNTLTTNYNFTRERRLSGSLDIDLPLNFTEDISAIVKFGGQYQYLTRSNDVNTWGGEAFGLVSGAAVINQLHDAFPWFQYGGENSASVVPFIDNNFNYGTFLEGDYALQYPLNVSRLQNMMDYVYNHQLPQNISYNYNIGGSLTNDYSGKEYTSAAYIMATIKLGQFLTIIPGIRYQSEKTVYTGVQGVQGPNPFDDYPNRIATNTEVHPYWLPDVLLRYKPLQWLDLRLAYTNTVSYPDYVALSPRVNDATANIQWNGSKLSPARSKNYDASVSVYENTIGLFTVGGFLKQIKDFVYPETFVPLSLSELKQYYPPWVNTGHLPYTSVQVATYVNNPYQINNYGVELDWQTHFWYLPSVLSGIVMNVNYTHIFSKAQYPLITQTRSIPHKNVSTPFYAPLLYQPDNILNVTLGFDYRGFSIRVSSLYSDKIFTSFNANGFTNLNSYTSAYTRWDVQMKQKLPMVDGLEAFINLYNINGADDESTIAVSATVPQSLQSYKSQIEAGIRASF